MKLTHFLAAATMIAGLGVSTAASAQDYRHDGRYERRDHRGYDDRRDYRDDRRHYGHDRGRHQGWNRHHRRCHAEYRHHHRVTVCYR